MRRRLMAGLGVLIALLAFSVPASVAAHDFARVGTVYSLTNSATGNAVLAYSRAADGSLSLLGTYATGGTGAGVLFSQGSVTLSADGRWLAAVDAGSNDVALFAVAPDGSLHLSSRVAAGGTDPISVTLHGPFVYVLDAGNGNIAGFVNLFGHLVALPGSIRPLSGTGTSPEEIAFSPDGGWLVVTELGTNDLVTYRVGFLGIAGAPSVYTPNQLAGLAGPYGFAFDSQGRLFVTEAGTSALSSYALSPTGVPSVISASVVNGQAGVCWVALTPDGRYAFTIDAHAAAVSSYAIAPNGSLTLINKTAATIEAPALDASVSGDGRFLYVVDVGTNTIDAFRIGPGASLSPIGSTSVPAGAAVGGLAAS